MHSRSTRSLHRPALTALLLAAFASLAHGTTFYKANNTSSLTSAASWWLDELGTTPAVSDNVTTTDADVPTNTTTPTAVCVWNSLVTGPNTVTLADVGIQRLIVRNPGGLITLDGVASARTVTVPSGGGIDMSQATQDLTFDNMFYRAASSGASVGLQVAAGRTLTFGASAQLNVRNNSTGVTINVNTDGTSAGTVKFGANFAPSFFVLGAGRAEFNRAGGNTRNAAAASQGTTVNGGTLVINNTSGSATGAGAVTVNTGGTLTGKGLISGAVSLNAGATLAPGEASVGSISAGALTLAAESKIIWEANNPVDADVLTVTGANGLTINGGTVSLYNPGTTDPLTAVGVFDLIKYSGALNGALTNLTLDPATQIAGRIYTLGLGANGVTLTIATEAAIERSWDADSSGTWSTAANWTADTVPDAAGTIANLTGASGATFSAPRTVTLDTPRVVGALALASTQSVTLDGSATLTFNNNLAAALLNSSGADHLVSAPLSLTAGGLLTDVAASTTLTLGGAIDGTGFGIVKSGAGTLLLTANNTYTGTTSVSAGTVQIGNGGTTGALAGPIASSGVLRFNRADSTALSSVISGTGEVQFVGVGDTTLGAANTYSGATTLSAGTLIIANAAALQNSTLTYSTSGGSLVVADPVAALTLGGLAGDRAIPLANTLGTPIALTVGGSGGNTSYSGSPTGTGTTFTKAGSGTFSVSGTHSYSGNGTVSGGVLGIETGSNFSVGGAFSLAAVAGAGLTVNGGTFTATGLTTITNASAGITINSGVANLNGGIINTAADSGVNFVNVNGGTLNTSSINLRRHGANASTTEPTGGATTNGLYIHGGDSAAVNVTGALDLGVNTNSGVSGRIDSGSLTVAGPVTVAISSPDRWTVLDVNGGTFTANDAVNGVFLGGNIAAGNVIMHVRGSGVAKVPRIQFGQGALGGKSYLNVGGGALYVGSGGLTLGSSNPAFLAGLRLGGGTLGATADWSSTLPVAINGSPSIVTGADELDAPRTITLQGAATGLGALTKNGAGTVRFTSPSNDYFGPTLVNAGRLGLAGHTSDVITVAAGATLAPEGALAADTGASIEGNLAIAYAASATPPVPSITAAAGGFTLGAASTLSLTGTGTLTAPAYVLLKGSSAVTGTFATVTGVPAGYSLSYAYDDDANEATPAVVALVASPLSPYESWAAGFPSLTDALPGSDPDGDGLSNFAEYALAQSPVESDAASAYTAGRSGNFLTLAFDHPADATLRYEVEAKSDLAAATWTVVHTFDPFTTAGTASYTDTVDVAGTPRRFLRLKVTQTP